MNNTISSETELEIWQDGQCVAAVSSLDRVAAYSDASHYVMVYRQDGPVALFEVSHLNGTRVLTEIPIAATIAERNWATGQS